ncbi:MAG: ABC transporter permease [Clostridia bacterium]|nr:ABC transporter permease [Clostridia bacterium]
MKAIYKRELFAYFTSPVGYIVLAAALCISGYLFGMYNLSGKSTSLLIFFSYLSLVFILLVPLMTMHLWAEERKNKTDQLLLTTNVPVSSIILGKYFASVTLFLINMVVMLTYPIVMSFFGMVIWSNVLMLYFGYFLLGCALLSVGLFVSTLTESQIVSAIVSFAIILLLKLVDVFAARIEIGFLASGIKWFSLFSRFNSFIWGVIDISTLIYYITFSGLFVFLSIMVIQKKRWS